MKTKVILFSLLAGARLVSGQLSEAEATTLQFMREEEKLAHDVYLALYEEYGSIQFTNIARSEQKHTDSVLYLMNLYGVEDTALEEAGVFSNPDLQGLYDLLIEQGMESRAAAFQVGILVEETDIADLDEAIEATENPDIIRVYTNLRKGSYNHLAAFTRALAVETGFDDATYQDGWFNTYMGWKRVDRFPWVMDTDGNWEYHYYQQGQGRYIGKLDGSWCWTNEIYYSWCYDPVEKTWFKVPPAP